MNPSSGKRIVQQTSCPFCPSSDAFTIYEENGKMNGWCYSCETLSLNPLRDLEGALTPKQATAGLPRKGSTTSSLRPPTIESVAEGLQHPIRPLPDRAISHATCEHYEVRVGVSPTDGSTPLYHLYPIYKAGQVSGFKQRFCDTKEFLQVGDVSDAPFFGQSVVPQKGKKLWITEGELDCLSAYQVLKETTPTINWSPAVVSLPNGAASAVKAVTSNTDFLDGYEEIILVFDNDAQGIKARNEVCKILAGKVHYLELPFKDPNEMLMAGKGEDLKWALLTKYKKYQPDGIVNAKDLWDRYKDSSRETCYEYPSYMPHLNEMTYGIRLGSIITVTAGTGSGKTQFLREMMYHYYHETSFNIGGLFLEEDVGQTMSGLISLHVNKRIVLPDVSISDDEEQRAFKDLFASGRFNFYDYFGGMDDANLLGKLRYLAAIGNKIIFLDHLSIVVSEYAAEGGERERIDTLMTKLAKFVKEHGVALFLVVHLRKTSTDGVSFEEGAPPTLDDLRGSGSLKQLSWDVLGLSRPQQHPDPVCANTTEVRVLKCRFTGRTGIADYLHFNQTTGRLINIDKPHGYHLSKKQQRKNQEQYEEQEF